MISARAAGARSRLTDKNAQDAAQAVNADFFTNDNTAASLGDYTWKKEQTRPDANQEEKHTNGHGTGRLTQDSGEGRNDRPADIEEKYAGAGTHWHAPSFGGE